MNESGLPSDTRQLLHTRQVTCTGFLRSDGLLEFVGTLRDTKPDDFHLPDKTVAAGDPVHDLQLRLVLDNALVVQDIEVTTLAVPTPLCHEVNGAYQRLRGLVIGPGFKRKVAEQVGGVLGCTHLSELLGPMATTVFQTTSKLFLDQQRQRMAQDPSYQPARHWVIGSCHAYRPEAEPARLIARLKP